MLTQEQIKQFKIRARAKGFTEEQIAQEVARKQQELTRLSLQKKNTVDTAPVVTDTTPVKEKRSLGGLAKNAVQDVVDFAINTPIQTAKSLAGAGYEGARAIDIALNKNKTDEKTLKRTSRKNPFIDTNALPSSQGEVFGGILKNIGRTLGLTQDESGRIVFNFDTAVQSAYEKPVTTALLAKDALSLVKKPKVSTTGKVGRVVEDQGGKLREGVLNPQTKGASPFVSEEMSVLKKVQAKLGLKGSARAQLEQLPELFRKSQKEIKSLLKKSKKTEGGKLSDEFLKQIDEANYGLDDPQFAKAVESEMNVLKKLDGGSALEQYSALEKYRNLLKSTRRKIDRGTTLLPKEEARLSAFNALKTSIDTVSPEVRALNTLQNQMYNISEGLLKSSKKKGIGIGPAKLPSEVSQNLQDWAGRLLTKEKTKLGASDLNKSTFLKDKIGIGTGKTGLSMAGTGALQVQGQNQEVQQPATTVQDNTASIINDNNANQNFQDNTSISHPIFGNMTKQQLLEEAFRSGLNSKQLDEVAGIYDRFAPAGGTVSEDTMKVANDLRKEYISETKNNNFRDITNSYKKVTTAPDTPAGDVSIIFAYMKMLDPSSVVREGEFATAEQTAGIPERIVNAYNKALKGKRLSDKQRKGYIEASKSVYDGYKTSQQDIDNYYTELAKKYGVDASLLGIGTIKAQ